MIRTNAALTVIILTAVLLPISNARGAPVTLGFQGEIKSTLDTNTPPDLGAQIGDLVQVWIDYDSTTPEESGNPLSFRGGITSTTVNFVAAGVTLEFVDNGTNIDVIFISTDLSLLDSVSFLMPAPVGFVAPNGAALTVGDFILNEFGSVVTPIDPDLVLNPSSAGPGFFDVTAAGQNRIEAILTFGFTGTTSGARAYTLDNVRPVPEASGAILQLSAMMTLVVVRRRKSLSRSQTGRSRQVGEL